MRLLNKLKALNRDAAARILASAAALQAKIRTDRRILTCFEMPVYGIIDWNVGAPRIDGRLGRGRHFSRYSSFQSGAYATFECNPGRIAFFAVISGGIVPQCMSEIAAIGFDAYLENSHGVRWIGSFSPKDRFSCVVRASLEISDVDGPSRIIMYFPLFAKVEYFEVATQSDSLSFSKPAKRATKSLVFYGSSITQGCAASKAGATLPNLVGRAMKYDVYNFGFSSSAHGETEIARRIARIRSDAIIVEYDHNATVEELRATHFAFYRTLRETNPSALIVFISRMSAGLSILKSEEAERFRIIRDTHEKAEAAGDSNTALIRGNELLPDADRSHYFADDRHPNQAGLMILARKIEVVLRERLER